MSQNFKKKEDNRIRYTKMRIRTAFYELLKETGYDKVTVTAVCDRAEINRATFYKHYLDIPDLVDKLQEEVINRLAEKYEKAKNKKDIEAFLIETLAFLKENNEGRSVMEIITPAGSSAFTAKISAMIYSRFSIPTDSVPPETTAQDRAMLFSYIAGGSAGIMDYWIKTGCKEKEEYVAKRIILLASSTMNNLSFGS